MQEKRKVIRYISYLAYDYFTGLETLYLSTFMWCQKEILSGLTPPTENDGVGGNYGWTESMFSLVSGIKKQ